MGTVGFEADSQADLAVHGGAEKAVHHYGAEHYEYWNNKFPEFSNRFSPGGFGENISTTGITEADLFVGDILELGSAVVQVSQGRQPCWKLNAHTGNDKMAYWFQKTGHTGWYYRVLKAGEVTVGDQFRLLERPNSRWSLAQVIEARFNPRLDRTDAQALAGLPQLAQGWRDAFKAKLDHSRAEDTSARLDGP